MDKDEQQGGGRPRALAGRLESWKEIASYLGRGVRTVRRWEKEEGLPVHRHVHNKLGTVYAHRAEIDAWANGRRSSGAVSVPPGAAQPGARSGPVMIAVVPFENLGGGPDQEYLADGLTEEMISQLGRLDPTTFGVIARTTVMQYKERHRTVRQIAHELRVAYVLEGSVRCEGDRARVAARLVDGSDQRQLWAGMYEQPIRGILAVQRELAAAIGREIRLRLSPGPAPGTATQVVNPEAYRAYLEGRYFLNAFTPDSVRRSVACFEAAIAADAEYAAPHASLAEAYERLPMWVDSPPTQTFGLALKHAEIALRLDPGLPEAHASLAMIHANYLWDWAEAARHFQRALELNPGCSPARQWYAEFLAEMGRTDEALLTIDRAIESDPLSRVVQATRAFVLLLARRFDEAIAQAEQTLKLDPGYAMALIRLGLACDGKGLRAEAIRALERAEVAAPGLLDCTALLGYAHARAGNARDARDRLAHLQNLARDRYVPAFVFSGLHIGLGEHDEAVRRMEQEYDARGWYLLLLRCAHQFDPLRSHPRFQALVERMKFPA